MRMMAKIAAMMGRAIAAVWTYYTPEDGVFVAVPGTGKREN